MNQEQIKIALEKYSKKKYQIMIPLLFLLFFLIIFTIISMWFEKLTFATLILILLSGFYLWKACKFPLGTYSLSFSDEFNVIEGKAILNYLSENHFSNYNYFYDMLCVMRRTVREMKYKYNITSDMNNEEKNVLNALFRLDKYLYNTNLADIDRTNIIHFAKELVYEIENDVIDLDYEKLKGIEEQRYREHIMRHEFSIQVILAIILTFSLVGTIVFKILNMNQIYLNPWITEILVPLIPDIAAVFFACVTINDKLQEKKAP